MIVMVMMTAVQGSDCNEMNERCSAASTRHTCVKEPNDLWMDVWMDGCMDGCMDS